MEFFDLQSVKAFSPINSKYIEGYDDNYCEKSYKVFYSHMCSFIYNTKNNEFIKFNLISFHVSMISEEHGSLFLFKISIKLNKKQRLTLYRYNLNTGELENEYSIYEHYKRVKNFEIEDMTFIDSARVAILISNYDQSTYSLIILNLETNESEMCEINNDMIDGEYFINELTFHDGNLYIPYSIRKLNGHKYLEYTEKGILKYQNKTIKKMVELDKNNSYKFFTDTSNQYACFVVEKDLEYDVYLYKQTLCILKLNIKREEGYFIGERRACRFGFAYSHEELLFYIENHYGYKVYNLDKKTIYRLLLPLEEDGMAMYGYLLANNKILLDIKKKPANTNRLVHDICEFNVSK